MKKSDREAWNARSHRNRHNGKINAYKGWILNNSSSQEVEANDGQKYKVLVTQRALPLMGHEPLGTEPLVLVKTQIVCA